MSKHKRPRLTEHGLEPLPGLPEALPPGETLLWQGAPLWTDIAKRVFLVHWVLAYFLVLAAWEIANAGLLGADLGGAIASAFLLLLVGGAALLILALLAKAVARTSLYTITSRRLVLRVGVALPITINIPFVAIAGAYLRQRKDGIGDIVLELLPTHRISLIALWPHCSGWSFGRPRPMLRGIRDVVAVAEILGNAVANTSGISVSRSNLGQDVALPDGAAAIA